MKKGFAKKSAVIGAVGAAAFALVLATAAPAMAAITGIRACYANGTGSPTTGTLYGAVFTDKAISNETYYGGQCGYVEVKGWTYLPGGTVYETPWIANSTYASTATYPAMIKAEHDSNTSQPVIKTSR